MQMSKKIMTPVVVALAKQKNKSVEDLLNEIKEVDNEWNDLLALIVMKKYDFLEDDGKGKIRTKNFYAYYYRNWRDVCKIDIKEYWELFKKFLLQPIIIKEDEKNQTNSEIQTK
jgi:protein tyrosine phosphatase